MRILLQNKITKQYLGAESGWTPLTAEARNFRDICTLVLFTVKNTELKDTRIVMDLSDEFGHERWNSFYEIRANGHDKNPNHRRMVYHEQQSDLSQTQ